MTTTRNTSKFHSSHPLRPLHFANICACLCASNAQDSQVSRVPPTSHARQSRQELNVIRAANHVSSSENLIGPCTHDVTIWTVLALRNFNDPDKVVQDVYANLGTPESARLPEQPGNEAGRQTGDHQEPNKTYLTVRLEMELVARASRDFEHQGRRQRYNLGSMKDF